MTRTSAARRARPLPLSALIVAILGGFHGAVQWWGDGAWFRRDLPEAPLVWWALPTNLIFWTLGVCALWAIVVGFVEEQARKRDRRRWWLGYPGVAVIAVVSLTSSYLASRPGMALFTDRVILREGVLRPLETLPRDSLHALVVECRMVRRPRSVRADDLIDLPIFHLVPNDGRRIRLGGVRGAGIGELSQEQWLMAMRQFSTLPRLIEYRSRACVDNVVSRFPLEDQAFVRQLFAQPSAISQDHIVCAPGRSISDGGCVRVPLAPGPPRPVSIPPAAG